MFLDLLNVLHARLTSYPDVPPPLPRQPTPCSTNPYKRAESLVKAGLIGKASRALSTIIPPLPSIPIPSTSYAANTPSAPTTRSAFPYTTEFPF